LLYIGKTESSQEERDVGEHLANGKTGQSTPRRSLGALLREQLNLRPQPRSHSEMSEKRFTNYKFDEAGEEALTAWMKKHLGLGFCELAELTVHELESTREEPNQVGKTSLNILNNPEGPYRSRLESARKHCATLARGGA
jgi:hypothetical protein